MKKYKKNYRMTYLIHIHGCTNRRYWHDWRKERGSSKAIFRLVMQILRTKR